MALAQNLPISKVCYDLLTAAVDFVQHMPRPFKKGIGDRLNDLCIELVLLVYRANCAKDKRPHLDALIERLQVLELLFRLCMDKRFISRIQYARGVELTTSIGKQATGWRKHNAVSPAT